MEDKRWTDMVGETWRMTDGHEIDIVGDRWIDGHDGTDGWTDMEDDRWTDMVGQIWTDMEDDRWR